MPITCHPPKKGTDLARSWIADDLTPLLINSVLLLATWQGLRSQTEAVFHRPDNHELAAAFYHIGPLPLAQRSEDVYGRVYTTAKLEGP